MMEIPKNPEELKKWLHELYENRPTMIIYGPRYLEAQQEAYRKIGEFLKEHFVQCPEDQKDA